MTGVAKKEKDSGAKEAAKDPRTMSFEELFNMDILTVAYRPWRGSVGRFTFGPEAFYIKKYKSPGKKIFRYFFKSKAQKEFENQLLFQKLGIDIPEIVIFKERGWFRRRAVLVTREVPRSRTLLEVLSAHPAPGSSFDIENLLKKLSDIVRKLHDSGFIHNDLRMRNVMVQDERLLMFDCPNGMVLRHVPFFFRRRKIKDLALLFEDAKHLCSAPQMLRFFLRYAQTNRLDEKHKKTIRQVVRYYD